jgi:hypothetical protein
VIFSCGSIIHNEDLIIPYAMSDHTSTYATVNLKELLNELRGMNSVNSKTLVSANDNEAILAGKSKMKVA